MLMIFTLRRLGTPFEVVKQYVYLRFYCVSSPHDWFSDSCSYMWAQFLIASYLCRSKTVASAPRDLFEVPEISSIKLARNRVSVAT